MRIALAQLDLLIGDIDGAMGRIARAAVEAKAGGADLLVCPELAAIGGYPPRDLLERPWLVERQWRALETIARTLPLPTLVGAIEPLPPGTGFAGANALVAISGGAIVASYHKRLLPSYDVFDEQRYFRPGDEPCIVELAGERVGLTVCEDIWGGDATGVRYHQDPLAELIGNCDLVVNVSASPYHLAKPELRRKVVAAAARRVEAPLAYCNQVGGQDELLFDGESSVVAPDGRHCALAPRWREALTFADLDTVVNEPPPIDEAGDLYQALVVGIRDYCVKTGQQRVVLGLSGGIDSALVAALAADALGAQNVIGLLMPGPYSSPGSISDAIALADKLGITHHTLPISAGHDTLLKELQPVFAGRPADVAEENLQSRLRGVLVMAVANKLGAMALTTGNKSELACGYCTIYGDMNGGLAPIADLYKTQVWQLARHANRAGERIPEASITKPPSAELRENQLDQDSLPPYADLDRILRLYLEETLSVEAIIAHGEDAATVRRVVRLVEVSEFKRRQSAPGLRVSPKAFGVGRRMPVARFIG